MQIDWNTYNPGAFYDELISSPGHARTSGEILAQYLSSLKSEDLQQRKTAAELAIKAMGISFTVYSEAGNIDREWPFDIIPRITMAEDKPRIGAEIARLELFYR